MTPEELRAHAEAAIQAGADPYAVHRQLNELLAQHAITNGADPVAVGQVLRQQQATLNQQHAPNDEPTGSSFGEKLRAAPHALAAEVAQVISSVPGGKRALAMVTPGGTYEQNRAAIDAATSELPPVSKIGGTLVGAYLTGRIPGLPTNPVTAGAAIGGAGKALSADTMSPLDRLKGTLVGAGEGALVGKATDMATSGIRALAAPRLDANLEARAVAQDAASSPKFDAFRALGDLGPLTPTGVLPNGQPETILDLPLVARALRTVQGESPVLAKLPPTDARVLDAVYKRVGDKAFSAAHGYEPAEALRALRSTIEDAANRAGGSYTDALASYAGPAAEQEAVTLGAKALRNELRPTGTAFRNAPSESPAAFSRWLPTASEGEQQGASEGVLGALKQSMLHEPIKTAAKAMVGMGPLGKAGPLARAAESAMIPQARNSTLAALLATLTGQ